MTRPRAADDFAAIRARMEELRRERMPASSDDEPRPAASRQPIAGNRPAAPDRSAGSPPVIRRPLFR